MKVRPCSQSTVSDKADYVAGADGVAGAYTNFAKMSIMRGIAAGVLHCDKLSVSLIVIGKNHDALANCSNPAPLRCSKVDALMESGEVLDRVNSEPETA